MKRMTRPCFLVIDREYAGSISTRKLVIETAKLNVITAYSGAEAIATLERFLEVDGIVLDAGITDLPCEEVIARLKTIRELPVVVVGTPRVSHSAGADYFVETFEPVKLLSLLQQIVPAAERVRKREETGPPSQQ